MDTVLREIANAVVAGNKEAVEAQVRAALDAPLPPEQILNDGLIGGMTEIGARFERGDCYVAEMLVAARAMQAGVALLKPHLGGPNVEKRGTVVLGTVRGDLHDIGKNLVGMMLRGVGFEIVDLGTDVSADKFVAAAREHRPAIVGLSALLTTTMESMRGVIEALEGADLRPRVKVLVGGAPLTEAYAREIGADGYAPDAGSAARLARDLCGG